MPPEDSASTDRYKVSCLNCRLAKRKCHTSSTLSICMRCMKQKLVCEYKEHQRGRRLTPSEVTNTSSNKRQISAHIVRPSVAHSLSNTVGSNESHNRHEGVSFLPHDNPATSIGFSHVVPITGDSWPYIQGHSAGPSRNPLSALRNVEPEESREHVVLERMLVSNCPDPHQAGILSRSDTIELFNLYFSTLNLLVPLLDPVLCTVDSCQKECPLLFTAILTMMTKVLRPRSYRSCLLLANKMLGQVFEQGQASVGIVQAILLLVHFKESEDTTGWSRIGYAIRMALELRLNNFRINLSSSSSSREKRELLNSQRTWLNLLISDFHMAIHHSLPRMISDDGIEDVDVWLDGHADLQIRGENILPALIEFSRMCRLYADLLQGINGDDSSLRLLAWTEKKWKRWQQKYLIGLHGEKDTSRVQFERLQRATLLLCDRFFGFHIAEFKLLFRVRYRSESMNDIQEPNQLSFAFNQCIEAAMGPPTIFIDEYYKYDLLPYASNIFWVAMAITSVWLIRNLHFMSTTFRQQVLEMLNVVQKGCKNASRTSADLPAYMSRLLKHLLDGQEKVISVPPSTMDDLLSFTTKMLPSEESARQLIQDQLWSRRASLSTGDDSFSTVPATNNLENRQSPSHSQEWENPRITLSRSGDELAMQTEGNSLLFPSMDDDFW